MNVALPAGTGDAGWLRAFHAVVPELLAEFRPQVLVTQHGADTHFEDPLAHLAVSLDAQRAVRRPATSWRTSYAEDGRWVALGGGGYAVVDVVPRSWTHLVGIAAARRSTRSRSSRRRGGTRSSPGRGSWGRPRMTDGRTPSWRAWEDGYDPADRLDQAVLATRRSAFPLRGLPWGPWDGRRLRQRWGGIRVPARWVASGAASIGRVLSTGALRAHLLAARLAGPVATPRETEPAELPALRRARPAGAARARSRAGLGRA